MGMMIRAVRRGELPRVYDLLEAAFPEARRGLFVAQTERDSTFRLRHGRVAIVDGRVAGYVRIFARTMLVRGAPLAAGGIGSVATEAGARHGGVATALMLDAIEVMRREGMAVSFLFTGIPAFYERVGYRVVRERSFAVPAEKAAGLSTTGLYDVRLMGDTDVRRLVGIHQRASAGATGAVRRTRRQWLDATAWLEEDVGGCFVAELRGMPVAYMRCRQRDYGYQVIEAESLPGHFDAMAAMLARAAGRALDLGCETIGGLAPRASPLAVVLESLSSRMAPVRHPMMMRALVDDAAIEGAIGREAVRFWNADRI